MSEENDQAAGPEVERRILEIVQGLVAELRGSSHEGRVSLDDSLDRDLGLGSLERVELMLRLEQAFSVALPDAVMAEAEQPRDLVAAILSGAPSTRERCTKPAPLPGPAASAPESAATLPDVLRWQAEANPDRVHIFLREDNGTEAPITYRALWERASAVAAGLRERRLRRGDSVALMLRTEEAFFPAFFGILLCGGVPVPIYPPFRLDRLEEYAERAAGILRNAEARLLLTFPEAERLAGLLRGRVPSLGEVTTIARIAGGGDAAPEAGLAAGDPALIQYTSGSTGAPKGVLLTHANLLANIRSIAEGIAIRADDVAVSWLPLYHDMGLIGSWLAALYYAIPIAILSPLAFLSRPVRWLHTIQARRGTLSCAPNFAFDLCVRKIRDDEIEGLDLSSWRLAFNGSEPVSSASIERFTRRFAPYGFRPEAMCPVYGLAESAAGLTVSPIGRLPRVDRIERAAFERRREARPAAAGAADALEFVAVGRALPGHEVRVVGDGGQTVGQRIEGRVEFRGPSVTPGYFRNPEATRAAGRDGWMDSGDLGYWAEADLVITGRRKDMIIKAGRNLYPQELEEAVGSIPGVRKGCVAAFGVNAPEIGTERLVVVAETRHAAADDRARLREAVVERVVVTAGVPPDTVVITAPGAVLKTSSGKIRRSATREAYVSGRLGASQRSVPAQWARLIMQDLTARTRRGLAVAARFAYAAYVWAVVGMTVPIFWVLLLSSPAGRSTHRLVRFWCRILLWLAGCPIRLTGAENLPGPTPAILVANHASYVDSLVLMAVLPLDFRFVAKRELLSRPLVGTIIRKCGHLPVERFDRSQSLADAERVVEALRGGVPLLFFPEGTFVESPGLLPFRLGAFKAAVEVQCPVVPVAVRGTREVLPPDCWLPRPGIITVTVAALMKPEEGGWRAMVRLRDLVKGEIARAVGEPEGAHAGADSRG
jgi:fatty-acyl-CoA synthase